MTPSPNGSGIEYPTITLAGHLYTVKFTQGTLMFRLSEKGIDLRDLSGPRALFTIISTLHACLQGQFFGTAEQLADIVMSEGKMMDASQALNDALKKVFPPTAAAPAATIQPAANQPN